MLEIVRAHVIPAAYALLPPAMASTEATAFLLAIGQVESEFAHRRQIVRVDGVAVPGRAIGLWQFEEDGATKGVLSHRATSALAREALVQLRYRRDLTVREVWERLEHNDVLAAVFARLLLWTLPEALPRRDQPDVAWWQYADPNRGAWRPGKPHPEKWPQSWELAWRTT